MNLRRSTIALGILMLLAGAIHADSLLVGTVTLDIGMPEDEARRLLSNRYTLAPVDNVFMISDKRSTPPNVVIGRIGFSAGKVVWVSRFLASPGPKPVEHWEGRAQLATQLLATLRRLSGEGSRNGVVSIKEGARGPQTNVDFVRFQFQQRSVTLYITQGSDDSIEMEESVEAR